MEDTNPWNLAPKGSQTAESLKYDIIPPKSHFQKIRVLYYLGYEDVVFVKNWSSK